MKVYNKLVRDKIPEIIEADGKVCRTHILSNEEYIAALEAKLRFAEKNLKVEDDFYMGYVSCMEDILVFINSDKEDRLENDNT